MGRKKSIFRTFGLLAFLWPTAGMAQEGSILTVERLFELVEQNSKPLIVAKSGAEAAGHGVAAAKSERLPDIGASLSVSYLGNVLMTDRDFSNSTWFSSPHLGNNFTLEAQQVLYSGGALTAGVRMAEIEKSKAETKIVATRNAERFMAMAGYLELLEADNAIRVYERNIRLTEKFIADIKAKREQGMALKNDITRYELQMESLRLGLRRIRDNRSIINHRLCNTLGIEEGVILHPDTTLLEPSLSETEQAWQAKASACSPELIGADLQIEAAQQQLKLAKSELLPKLAVFAADNFNGPFTYDLPPIDNNFNIWYVGVGVSYNLSSLFKSNKKVRRANVSLRESQEARAQTAEDIDNRINEAHTLYLEAFTDLRTRQKSAQLARENYEVVESRYLNDLALITDMTDASNLRLSAELDETNARIRIVYAYYKIKYIAGEI